MIREIVFSSLSSGNASVIKALGTNEERLLRIFSPGDYTGEMSLLEPDGLRTATVRADTPLQAYEMTRPDFDELLSRNPKIAIEMLREFSQRLRNSQQATIGDLQIKNIELTKAYRELQEAQVQIIEKERLERELQVARQIQMSMLPGELPQLQDYEFGAQILPARAVGGDLFDFIDLGNDLLGITIADVSDKGVPAALFMALTRSLLRAVALSGESPATVLRKVNHHLLGMNQAAMFVSVLYGIYIDHQDHLIMHALAMSCLPWWIRQVKLSNHLTRPVNCSESLTNLSWTSNY